MRGPRMRYRRDTERESSVAWVRNRLAKKGEEVGGAWWRMGVRASHGSAQRMQRKTTTMTKRESGGKMTSKTNDVLHHHDADTTCLVTTSEQRRAHTHTHANRERGQREAKAQCTRRVWDVIGRCLRGQRRTEEEGREGRQFDEPHASRTWMRSGADVSVGDGEEVERGGAKC